MSQSISDSQIDHYVQTIEALLDQLDGNLADLSLCLQVHEWFETLREQYREYPRLFEPRLQQLRELNRRFEDKVARLIPLAVDHLHALNEQLQTMEKEKAFWRQALIRQAVNARRDRFEGSQAYIVVKAAESRALPARGSEQRQELEKLIGQAGCWEQVGYLSGPRLHKFLSAQSVGGAFEDEIDKLCPRVQRHQLSCRPKDGHHNSPYAGPDPPEAS